MYKVYVAQPPQTHLNRLSENTYKNFTYPVSSKQHHLLVKEG